MKTQDFEKIFGQFELTIEEMICIKGGDDGEPVPAPPTPPIKIGQ